MLSATNLIFMDLVEAGYQSDPTWRSRHISAFYTFPTSLMLQGM